MIYILLQCIFRILLGDSNDFAEEFSAAASALFQELAVSGDSEVGASGDDGCAKPMCSTENAENAENAVDKGNVGVVGVIGVIDSNSNDPNDEDDEDDSGRSVHSGHSGIY